MSNRKSLSLTLLVVIIGVLLLGVFHVSAQEKKGGTFVIADALSNVELDPFITSWHSWPHYALFSTLFWKDKNLNYVGYLADTWEASADGKTLTVNLIQNAKFSDDTPVNAEALKWNLLHYIDKEVASPSGANLIDLLLDVEVTGEFSFKMHLASAYAPLYNLMAGLEIVSPTAYQKEGRENFKLHPVGAGPFLLKEINTNNYYSFERNPDFTWAPSEIYENTGPVNLDGFTIKFIEDQQTILSALETGEIQLAGIPSQNLADVQANPDISITQLLETGIRYMGFNTSKAPWNNVELRRALSYAVDREAFVKLAWDDQAVPLYQPLPPSIWGHNPDLDATSYHYDPDKAKAMLDELGFKDVDGDGIREMPDGKPWNIPFNTVTGDEWKKQAEVLEAQFRDVGVKIDISPMELPALRELTTTGTHDLFLLLYGETDPYILTFFFDPKRLKGSNRTWFTNDKLTELLYAGDADLNPKTRYETITEASKIIIDQAPWIFLAVPKNNIGIRNELKNWDFDPQGNFWYWNAYIEGG